MGRARLEARAGVVHGERVGAELSLGHASGEPDETEIHDRDVHARAGDAGGVEGIGPRRLGGFGAVRAEPALGEGNRRRAHDRDFGVAREGPQRRGRHERPGVPTRVGVQVAPELPDETLVQVGRRHTGDGFEKNRNEVLPATTTQRHAEARREVLGVPLSARLGLDRDALRQPTHPGGPTPGFGGAGQKKSHGHHTDEGPQRPRRIRFRLIHPETPHGDRHGFAVSRSAPTISIRRRERNPRETGGSSGGPWPRVQGSEAIRKRAARPAPSRTASAMRSARRPSTASARVSRAAMGSSEPKLARQ